MLWICTKTTKSVNYIIVAASRHVLGKKLQIRMNMDATVSVKVQN